MSNQTESQRLKAEMDAARKAAQMASYAAWAAREASYAAERKAEWEAREAALAAEREARKAARDAEYE